MHGCPNISRDIYSVNTLVWFFLTTGERSLLFPYFINNTGVRFFHHTTGFSENSVQADLGHSGVTIPSSRFWGSFGGILAAWYVFIKQDKAKNRMGAVIA